MSIETPFSNITDLQNNLDDLRRDIHHFAVYGQPASDSIVQAPLLQDWSLATLLCPCLIGRVTGHPLLGDRPNIHTSQIIAFDTERGWVRTWSRFYKLGASSLDVQRH
jgi:hypothetical protein